MDARQNEYAAQKEVLQEYLGYVPVSALSRSEQLAFYRQVYGLFFLGFLVLSGFAFLGMQLVITGVLPPNFILGGAVVLFVLSWFCNVAIQNKKVGLALMFLYAAIAGLTIAPLLILAMVVASIQGMHPYSIIGQAFGLTTLGFGGLTAYVFLTRQDFSWLGGIISIFSLVALGIVIGSWVGLVHLQGTFDLAFTLGMIGLMCLTVLYDTSQIVHHYGKEHTVVAAFSLLMSFFVMLWYVLRFLIEIYLSRD